MAGDMYVVGAHMERRPTRLGERPRLMSSWEHITEAQWLCSYWLKRADRRVSSNFAHVLKLYGISASEWAALRELYRPGRNSSVGLAPALGMTKGGASKLIDRLVRKGLASKEIGELDRRCRPVGLTKRGRYFVPYLARREEDLDRKSFRTENLRYHLIRALKRVVHARRNKRVDIWHVPRSKAPSLESTFYYPGPAPRPSAVASNASNSSDDSSRNLPRDK